MKKLLEDYNKKLETALEMFHKTDDYNQSIKLHAKINMYKEFITDIEIAIERNKKPDIQFDVEKSQEYLNKTPSEKLREDWRNSQKLDEVGTTCNDFLNRNSHIKLYWEACNMLFATEDLSEEWLDINNIHLPINISSVEEARLEIIKIINRHE